VRPSRLRLQYRIVLPMAAAAVLSTSVATFVGVRVTSNALRSRLEAQLVSSVSAVTWRDFATNRRILRSLSAVVGAQVVTIGPDAAVVATSLDGDGGPVVDAVRRVVREAPNEGAQPRVIDADCGYRCLIAYREVDASPGTVVALVADATPLASATVAVLRVMFVAAVAGLALLVLVSQIVVRRVTAPLERLVGFVRTASPHDAARDSSSRSSMVLNDSASAPISSSPTLARAASCGDAVRTKPTRRSNGAVTRRTTI
jgi:hypothetical protein